VLDLQSIPDRISSDKKMAEVGLTSHEPCPLPESRDYPQRFLVSSSIPVRFRPKMVVVIWH
jgi:hypothetical protein